MIPQRLTGIDDTNRDQHHYLEQADRCWFIGEYFSGKSYKGGPTNQLIFNLKTEPSVIAKDSRRGYYKERAIAEVADALPCMLSNADIEEHTWVPIPPSKCPGHPDYDDRMQRILTRAFQNHNADVRPLLRQTRSTVADHVADARLSPEELYEVLDVDQEALDRAPIRSRGIVLFDDVLVTGKHFKRCQQRLREVVAPNTRIIGIFVARRLLPEVTFDPVPDDV